MKSWGSARLWFRLESSRDPTRALDLAPACFTMLGTASRDVYTPLDGSSLGPSSPEHKGIDVVSVAFHPITIFPHLSEQVLPYVRTRSSAILSASRYHRQSLHRKRVVPLPRTHFPLPEIPFQCLAPHPATRSSA